jgi:F0F1-type ATP synthase membrane subunit c/vacuolar-type H+-ATPase subunit K
LPWHEIGRSTAVRSEEMRGTVVVIAILVTVCALLGFVSSLVS